MLNSGKRWWWYRSRLRKADGNIVDSEQFVSMSDAKKALGFRTMIGINTRVISGHLERAMLKDWPWYTVDIGITRDSLEKEIERSSRESSWERLKRQASFIRRCL